MGDGHEYADLPEQDDEQLRHEAETFAWSCKDCKHCQSASLNDWDDGRRQCFALRSPHFGYGVEPHWTCTFFEAAQ